MMENKQRIIASIKEQLAALEAEMNKSYEKTKESINGAPSLVEAPIRKPILVTEDGVEVFEGDKCYCVNLTLGLVKIENMEEYIYHNKKNYHKFFSSKIAAEEYIKWNKPMYSLNDVSEARDKCFNVGRQIIDVLEKLDRK